MEEKWICCVWCILIYKTLHEPLYSLACLTALGRYSDSMRLVTNWLESDTPSADLFTLRARLHHQLNQVKSFTLWHYKKSSWNIKHKLLNEKFLCNEIHLVLFLSPYSVTMTWRLLWSLIRAVRRHGPCWRWWSSELSALASRQWLRLWRENCPMLWEKLPQL